MKRGPAREPRDDNDRMSRDPTIIAAAETPYSRHPAADLRTPALLADAARRALDDAGLAPAAIDGLGVASFTLAPDHAIDLAVALGLRVSWLMDAATGGAAGIDMLQHACAPWPRATPRTSCSWPATSSTRRVRPPRGRVQHRHARSPRADPVRRAERALRAAHAAPHEAHGLERADYGRARRRAASLGRGNPGAVYRTPLSAEEYLAAPLVADPLCLLDCVPVVAGADALIVSARGGGVRVRAAARRPQRRPAGRRRARDRAARHRTAALGRGGRRRRRDRRRSRSTTTTRRWR